MSLSLDHIVIRVQDLEQAITHFSALGFTVQRGGTHADGATRFR
jgi:catechol 2,3-dioxygenase-like lactoylglutathione lyase family enzyme